MTVVTWETIAPGITSVVLQRPPANALGADLLDGMHNAIDAAEKAGDVKVMVISSAIPGFFAAGADIKHLSSIDAETFTAYGDQMRAVNDRLAAAPFLSIAAVEGVALGGGLELAMAATLRVAGPNAKFGLPEVKIGLIPGAGGTQRLPRLVGRGRALDIMLTARQVHRGRGLRDRPRRPAHRRRRRNRRPRPGRRTRRRSLPAQLAVVRTVDAAFDLPLDEGARFEVAQEQSLFEDGEAAEGITAFIEKRRPRFA